MPEQNGVYSRADVSPSLLLDLRIGTYVVVLRVQNENRNDENVIRRACENASSRLRNLRSRGQSIRKESKCWIKKIDRTWKNKYMKYGQYNWENLNTSKQKKILWINALCYDCSVRL